VNTACCLIISLYSLTDTPHELNQSCKLELNVTTLLLHYCAVHRSLAFYFSFLFFIFHYIFLLPFLLYIFLCRFLLFLILCLFPFSFRSVVFSFCLLFLYPFSRFFLSFGLFALPFSQSFLCFLLFYLALFLAIFLSAFLPFHSLFVFIPVTYSAHTLWAVESHLSQECSLLGKFHETQQHYVNRQLWIFEEIHFLYSVFHFKLRVNEFQFISGSYTVLLFFIL
jgi:hypothetical protein